LEALGATGEDVVTTSYNHAGVVEAWSGGALRPSHAWPMLTGDAEGGWRALFATRAPRYVLVTDGENFYEGAGAEPRAIADALERAAAENGYRIAERWKFPTESGAPGWSLVRIDR
jgi:hypothetical protein